VATLIYTTTQFIFDCPYTSKTMQQCCLITKRILSPRQY